MKGITPLLLVVIGTIALGAAQINSAVAAQPTSPKVAKATSISSEEINEAEERLSKLGYWTGPVDGKLDEGSRNALIAFQKVTGRKRTGKLTEEELQAIRDASRPLPREVGEAHIVVDLSRQVLFVVSSDGMVSNILPVSTGSGKLYTQDDITCRAITPKGRFTIYNKLKGWRKSPLGLLYYPNYFHKGWAIHGNRSVPTYPASHGCVRIPIFASQEFSKMTPIGTVVVIHDGLLPARP